MSILVQQLSKLIVDKLIETKKIVPTRIKAGMYLHYTMPHYGGQPASLLEYAMHELLHRLFKSYNIKYVSTINLEPPLKGAYLFLHEFRTQDNLPIYSCELSSTFPQSPITAVKQSISELFAAQGCTGCSFGARLDEDEICNFCRNGETKKLIEEFLDGKSMAKTGWKNLSQTIGVEFTEIIEDLAKFHKKIITDEEFCKKCDEVVKNCKESDSYGNYLDQMAEDLLYLNLENFDDNEEE